MREGEPIVLLDRKDREYLARLDLNRPLAIRGGKVLVEELIGRDEGCTVRSSVNEPFLVFRPSLPQLIPNLPRNAQVVYPKDLGPDSYLGRPFPRRACSRGRRRCRRSEHDLAARHRQLGSTHYL